MRRLLNSEGVPIEEISRRRGVAWNTVRSALASAEPPKYKRAPERSMVEGYEPEIRRLLSEYPAMPATVIAERIAPGRRGEPPSVVGLGVSDRPSAGKLAPDAVAFAGTLSSKMVIAPPRGPEFKEMVERHNGYLGQSFIIGRKFSGPDDVNDQFTD